MNNLSKKGPPHHVVIVGGGFGGLYAAQKLRRVPVQVTLIDQRNYHLFQPLLYQVATGGLSAGDISSPIRAVLAANKNTQVLMEEVVDILPNEKQIRLKNGTTLTYDSAIVATGAGHHYFGRDEWEDLAPAMKTVEDALEVRRRIFLAFEAAEKELDPIKRQALLTFVVVGGGPTGVELAGALGELAHTTLKQDFRHINTQDTQILLLEGLDRLLPPYPPELSAKAEQSLEELGITVRTQTLVTEIEGDRVTLRYQGKEEVLRTCNVLWAAGVKASGLGKVLSERTGVELDRMGRVVVEPDLSVKGHPDLFVIGDLAHFNHGREQPLPGVAPVAMQEGMYVAKLIRQRLQQNDLPPFQYWDVGNLAVIGRHAAVADLGFIKFSGFFAWWIWVFAHIYYLIEFDNKLIVLLQWSWNYFTQKKGARLITGSTILPSVAHQVAQEMEAESLNPRPMVESGMRS
jgi:NADH:ubiquinone reductase (H+-translocating)